MVKRAIRFHKEVYEKILWEAQKEKRKKSAMVPLIIKRAIKTDYENYNLQIKLSPYFDIYKGTYSRNENTHTVYPPIGFSIEDEIDSYIGTVATVNKETWANIAANYVYQYLFDT